MKKHITASASSSSLLDSVTNLLSKFFNKLIDSLFSDENYDKKTDDKVSDETKKEAEEARKKNGKTSKGKSSSKNKDSDETTDNQPDSQKAAPAVERIIITPKDGSDKITIEKVQWGDTKDFYIKATSKKTGKIKSDYLENPSESQIKSTIESLAADVMASKIIQVSLNRIVGKSEDTIDITAINCSCDIGSAYSDICSILADDEFVDTIPEGESTYGIISTDDDYVINEYGGEIDCGSVYRGAFDCATAFYTCMFYLLVNRYLSVELSSRVESLKYSAQYHMDTLAKWAKMHDRTTEIKLCYCSDYCDTECPDGWTILETALSDYKNCLEALYSCATHEEQSVIDGWMLDIDYVLYDVDNALI